MEETERREAEEAEESAPEAADEGDEEPEAADEQEEEVSSEADADEEDTDESEASSFDESAGFPENFPRVSRLESAGVTSLADLRDVEDLTELDGIGSAYAEEISEALAEFDETGSVSS
jgi:small subunit ribosomal protein S1